MLYLNQKGEIKMTFHVVEWSDHEAGNQDQFQVFSSKTKASKFIEKIQNFEEISSITYRECKRHTKTEIINFINSLVFTPIHYPV
jgi:hypothetical protein